MITPDFNFEKSILPPNCRYLLGIDEVGRGPLAGPVAVGAFLLDLNTFNPDDFQQLHVRDSKTLNPRQRRQIFSYFKKNHYRFQVLSLSSTDIDRLGIGRSILTLILALLKNFQGLFDYCLVDGNFHLDSPHTRTLIKADQSCFSVAAAAICAKFSRDYQMDQYHRTYPCYGFNQHKGYGTSSHLAAIRQYGPCPIHRLSFKPLKK